MRRECRLFPVDLVTARAFFLLLHAKLAGASSIRHSLRPLSSEGVKELKEFLQTSGAWRREIAEARLLFSPPPRARSAWRGGVGGGGWLSVLSSIEFAEAPPPPTPPRNAQGRVGGGEKKRFKPHGGVLKDEVRGPQNPAKA